MNILKPQNFHFKELENKHLINVKDCEKIKYCNFENEKCNDINLIAISIEDIKGATINQFQSIDLLYLIGVNLK